MGILCVKGDKSDKNQTISEHCCKNIQGIEIVIQKGDIVELKVDAIVNPCDQKNATQVIKTAGLKIEEEISKFSDIPNGQAFTTEAGNLQAKYLIHLNLVKWQGSDEAKEVEKLKESIDSILKVVVDKKLVSVAFPDMFGGPFVAPVALGARLLFCNEKPKDLAFERFHIINHDQTKIKVYCNELEKLTLNITNARIVVSDEQNQQGKSEDQQKVPEEGKNEEEEKKHEEGEQKATPQAVEPHRHEEKPQEEPPKHEDLGENPHHEEPPKEEEHKQEPPKNEENHDEHHHHEEAPKEEHHHEKHHHEEHHHEEHHHEEHHHEEHHHEEHHPEEHHPEEHHPEEHHHDEEPPQHEEHQEHHHDEEPPKHEDHHHEAGQEEQKNEEAVAEKKEEDEIGKQEKKDDGENKEGQALGEEKAEQNKNEEGGN